MADKDDDENPMFTHKFCIRKVHLELKARKFKIINYLKKYNINLSNKLLTYGYAIKHRKLIQTHCG